MSLTTPLASTWPACRTTTRTSHQPSPTSLSRCSPSVQPYKTATHLSIQSPVIAPSHDRLLHRLNPLALNSVSALFIHFFCEKLGDGEQAAGAVLRDPARRQGRLAAGRQGGVQEPGAAVAPRQAPAGVEARGRGAVQGHHRGLRGAAGPAGEQDGVRCARRRQVQARREGPRRLRRLCGESSPEREGRRRCGAEHAAEGGVEEERVQRQQQGRGRPARVRRVRGAQGAAAGARAGVHARGALQRVQEGGQVHPRRRHQERADRQGGGDADDPGEAGVEERHQGDAARHGRRAAGLPGGRRRVRRGGEATQAVQAARRRPGAQGAGAAGERAHRVVALVQAARRREAALLVPRRGHLPRVREGRQGLGHARRRRREGRARGPQGQARRRVPREPHR